jgi:hypothetical protein
MTGSDQNPRGDGTADSHHGDIEFRIDLGELIPGHHVIATGITVQRIMFLPRWVARQAEEARLRPESSSNYSRTFQADSELTEEDRELVPMGNSGDELLYEFVPGIERGEHPKLWELKVTDSTGANYFDECVDGFDGGGSGGYEAGGGERSRGGRDFGRLIPTSSTSLCLEFRPPKSWTPPDPWIDRIDIDLVQRRVI